MKRVDEIEIQYFAYFVKGVFESKEKHGISSEITCTVIREKLVKIGLLEKLKEK